MSKVLGHGKSQKELSEFQQVLQHLTNLPVIHKKIMTHITNNNIAKLQHIQKQYLNGKSLMDKGKEIIMNSLTEQDYDSMICVYVNLSSSALAGGYMNTSSTKYNQVLMVLGLIKFLLTNI